MARRDSILVSRTLYQIGVISLIAAVMWVAVGIYSVTGQEFKTEIDKSVLEPLNPTLDQEVIQAMAGRLKVESDVIVPPVVVEEEQVTPPSTTIEEDPVTTPPAVIEEDLITTPENTDETDQGDTISVDEVR